MTQQYGVWSEHEDGFVSTGAWTEDGAAKDLQEILSVADSPWPHGEKDLRVRVICPDHSDEEQPADNCEQCNEELA